MSLIAHAIADREGGSDRLPVETKALPDVEQFLGASVRAARSSSRKRASAPVESPPELKQERKRRPMTAAEKKTVSER